MPDLRKHRERKSRVCMTKSRRANERQHKPHTLDLPQSLLVVFFKFLMLVGTVSPWTSSSPTTHPLSDLIQTHGFEHHPYAYDSGILNLQLRPSPDIHIVNCLQLAIEKAAQL